MTDALQALDDEFELSPDENLATELAREHQVLLSRLIERRHGLGMSQQDVADKLGLSQATISAFEKLGNDPHLSTLRRYCRAVGAMVRHHVEFDDLCEDRSKYLSHVTETGVSSVDTAAAIRRRLFMEPSQSWSQPVRDTSPVR